MADSATQPSKDESSWKTSLPKEDILAMRKNHLGSVVQIFFKENPLHIVRGKGQYLYDEKGREYLDCINNVAHVGHSHPYVGNACFEQMSVLNTNCRFLHKNIVYLAKRITDTMPKQLSVCFLVNSGSEANDLALRLARYATGSKETVTLDHAYHGHVTSLVSISPYKHNHPNSMDDKGSWVHVVPTPDRYRGKYRDDKYSLTKLTDLYVKEVEETCQKIKASGKKVSAFFAESMQSCGGQIIFPEGYLSRVYKCIREAGGICVADEVQTGFGRVGNHMWAFQEYGEDIIPDIVTIGKPMGNGFPVSALVTTPEIAEAFRRGPDYFNTFGGNPVSCAVALAVLDVIENENLLKNARDVGDYFHKKISGLSEKHEIIGDIRGSGMFYGIDLVKDRSTRAPATRVAKLILQKLRDAGVLMSLDGPFNNVLKFKPPMCFSKANVDFLVTVLDRVFTQINQEQFPPRSAVGNQGKRSIISDDGAKDPCHPNHEVIQDSSKSKVARVK